MNDAFKNYDSWKLATPPEYDCDDFYCDKCNGKFEEEELREVLNRENICDTCYDKYNPENE